MSSNIQALKSKKRVRNWKCVKIGDSKFEVGQEIGNILGA